MICSVPHTGTRTLAKHLGQDYMHYGQHDIGIAKLDEHIHFPMRDPLAVTISWMLGERNYSIGPNRLDEFRRWDLAFKHLKTVDHTIHKIEDFPVLDGVSKRNHLHQWYQERNMEKIVERVASFDYLCDWMKDKDLFRLYYDLWWLK